MSERATAEEMRQWLELEVWLRAMVGLVETARRRAGWQQAQRIRPLVLLLEQSVHRVEVLAEDATHDVEQAAAGVCEDCGTEGAPERLIDCAGADRCPDCAEDYEEGRREDAADARAEALDDMRRSEASLPWSDCA